MSLVFGRGGEAPGMLGTCADAVWGMGVVVGIVLRLGDINKHIFRKIFQKIPYFTRRVRQRASK